VTLHQQAGPVGAGEVVYSTLSGQPETEELLAAYVADVRKTTQELQKAALAGDFAAVRDHCLSLRGSAPGYGFPSLVAAAEEAVQAPDATLSVSHARPKLRTLLLICGQLGIRKAAAPAKPDVERLV
jgi:HPt (histidine-containing phosphotransfer) domain-containing protein